MTFIFSNTITPNDATKPSNPKDALGAKKVPFSTIPPQVMGEVALALLEGRQKYGGFNWRASGGIRASIYYDACLRHITEWFEGGGDIDQDSGLHHITKAIACLVVLRDSQMQGLVFDDRPPKTANGNWMRDLNKLSEGVIEKYPNAKEAFTEAMHGGIAEDARSRHAKIDVE